MAPSNRLQRQVVSKFVSHRQAKGLAETKPPSSPQRWKRWLASSIRALAARSFGKTQPVIALVDKSSASATKSFSKSGYGIIYSVESSSKSANCAILFRPKKYLFNIIYLRSFVT